MPQPSPSVQDIDVLLAFLPKLYAEGARTFADDPDEEISQEGVLQIGSPNYSDAVIEFFDAARRPIWNDHDYVNKHAGKIVFDPSRIAVASLQDMKTILTFCVRGERFCAGHWGELVEEGQIRYILNRLAELRKTVK